MPLPINTRVNHRYRILEVIAVGGMGSIYRALDESLNIEVALKENLFSSHESARQFHYEAKILANLKHPNLPRVTDHFSIPDQGQYLVMDFVYGEDLKDRIEKHGILTEKEARLIGAAICDALTYLHHQEPRIIHRDIKPGNIKISPNGDVFLVDFGLAKQISPEQETTTGAQALTPGYAPPEQYGQGTEPRSDIYSLGATLYASVTGEIPVDGLARTIGSSTLIPLQSLNKTISTEFVRCIEKAMAVSPEDRYQNADLFKDDLLASTELQKPENGAAKKKISPLNFNELPTKVVSNGKQIPSDSRTVHSNSFSTKPQVAANKSVPWIAILIIVLAMMAAGIWVVIRVISTQTQANTPPTAASPATEPVIAETKPTESTPSDQAVSPTIEQASATPENTQEVTTPQAAVLGGGSGRITFASNRSGIPQIWSMLPDGTDPKQLTTLPDGACYPSWSPDGKKLVITSPCRVRQEIYKGSALFILNADGTGMRPILSVPGGDFNAVWSPDGKKLLFSSIRDNINVPHIYVMDMENNQAVTRVSSISSYDLNAAWSPDGSQIVFETTRAGVSQIWIMNADGSDAKEFTKKDSGAGYMPDWSKTGDIMIFSFGSTHGLFAKQITNRAAPEVEITPLRPVLNASFSPDSYWIAFEGQENGNQEIFLVTVNGSNLLNLTQNPAEDFHPVWQPAVVN
jgi:serine/threonine protein kinase